jgi:hypothetical protein
MDAAVRTLITALHQSSCRSVLALPGGGAGAAAWLLSVPGGSRTVLEVLVPYGEEALGEYLGRRPASFCSAQTARDLAGRARERARWLAPGVPVAGLGCTASLRSDRPKRGDHRFHLCVETGAGRVGLTLTFTKDARDREGEELVLDLVLLNLLAEALGVPDRLAVPLLPGEEILAESTAESGGLGGLLAGNVRALRAERDGQFRVDAPAPALLLPGSFNPVHEGHCVLAETAARLVGRPALFELSVVNADKPPLTAEEVRRRLVPLAWRAPVWLTRAPTFAEKADLFPGAVFVVGVDTAARIVDPRFYQDSAARLAEALEGVRSRGCRFLVAGRVGAEGKFVGLEDLDLAPAHRDLFSAIPENAFRVDLSSTQLRGKSGPQG